VSICNLHWPFTFFCSPIGGLAGAASRITGAMAKGVAAITMDEDYQQKRREAMNKQPTGLREGITRGGKGLVSVRRKKDVKRLSKVFMWTRVTNTDAAIVTRELLLFILVLVLQTYGHN